MTIWLIVSHFVIRVGRESRQPRSGRLRKPSLTFAGPAADAQRTPNGRPYARRASVGLRRAALAAGYSPASAPMISPDTGAATRA